MNLNELKTCERFEGAGTTFADGCTIEIDAETSECSKYESADAPVSLWLVDDDEKVRALIAELLERNPGLRCERQFSSAEELLSALAEEEAPQAILMDVNMGGMTGIEALRPIKRLASHTRVFIMTTFYDSFKENAAKKGGANGFFLKNENWERNMERILEAPEASAELELAQAPALAPLNAAPWFARAMMPLRTLLHRTALARTAAPQ